MDCDTLLDILRKHNVLKLVFFRKSLKQWQLEVLAKVTKQEISTKIKKGRIKVTVNKGVITLNERVINIKDVMCIHIDKHNHNIIYILGNNISCALYIIK